MFNKVLIIVILVLTIATSGCSPHREHDLRIINKQIHYIDAYCKKYTCENIITE